MKEEIFDLFNFSKMAITKEKFLDLDWKLTDFDDALKGNPHVV